MFAAIGGSNTIQLLSYGHPTSSSENFDDTGGQHADLFDMEDEPHWTNTTTGNMFCAQAASLSVPSNGHHVLDISLQVATCDAIVALGVTHTKSPTRFVNSAGKDATATDNTRCMHEFMVAKLDEHKSWNEQPF